VKALSIKQPWVWLIVNGHKDVENRNWPTRFRGRLLVHAGKKVDRGALEDLRAGIYPVTGHPHRFDLPDAFEPGGHRWRGRNRRLRQRQLLALRVPRLRDRLRSPFRPCRGALGFFEPSEQ
jgi:hypothetical protein